MNDFEKTVKIYKTLRELYGNDITDKTLFIRARIDGVITNDEKRKLSEFRK